MEALYEAQGESDRLENFRAGLAAAAVYNCAPREKSYRKIMQPLDFFKERGGVDQPRRLAAALSWLTDESYAAKTAANQKN